jgi:hypothetical protein
MPVGLKERPEELCDTILVAAPAGCVSCCEEDHVVAGSGACRACQREGKNPKTGGKPCGGYIDAGYNPYPCKTCGHAYDQHS